jgi:uncharacterized protein (DUF885 family)
MTNDLSYGTSPTIVYAKAYDNETSSLRRSVARGVNLPDDLVVKQQAYTDSTAKLPGTRTTVHFERQNVDANLMQIKPRIYLVAEIPSTTAQADIDKLVEVFRAGVADTTNNLLTLAIAGQK